MEPGDAVPVDLFDLIDDADPLQLVDAALPISDNLRASVASESPRKRSIVDAFRELQECGAMKQEQVQEQEQKLLEVEQKQEQEQKQHEKKQRRDQCLLEMQAIL